MKATKEPTRVTRKPQPTTYNPAPISAGTLLVNQSVQGETLERKIERILNNKEPIKDGAPIIYTERKEGIRASTNIRTDRMEIAVEATDKIAKSYKARREEKAKSPDKPQKDGGAESIQGKPQEGTEKP